MGEVVRQDYFQAINRVAGPRRFPPTTFSRTRLFFCADWAENFASADKYPLGLELRNLRRIELARVI